MTRSVEPLEPFPRPNQRETSVECLHCGTPRLGQFSSCQSCGSKQSKALHVIDVRRYPPTASCYQLPPRPRVILD